MNRRLITSGALAVALLALSGSTAFAQYRGRDGNATSTAGSQRTTNGIKRTTHSAIGTARSRATGTSAIAITPGGAGQSGIACLPAWSAACVGARGSIAPSTAGCTGCPMS